MNITGMLFAGLLSLAVTSAQAQFVGGEAPAASSDAYTAPRLAGTFQRYDASSRVMRISDIEYSVSADLVRHELGRVRGLRSGSQVLFNVSGFDTNGRDVIVEITAK